MVDLDHHRGAAAVPPAQPVSVPIPMHPPKFSFKQRLSDWPDCFLELQCCKGVVLMPVPLLLKRHGDHAFDDLLRRLRCEQCGSHPAPVYLCASHFRRGNGLGSMADWAVELVGPPADRR